MTNDDRLRREIQRWYRVTALWLAGVLVIAVYGLVRG